MAKADKYLRAFGPRQAGLLLVLALHGAALYGLWRARLIPLPVEAAALVVVFIAPPDEKTVPEPKRPPEGQPKPKPRPKPPEPSQPWQLVTETPLAPAADHVVAAPPSEPEPTQEPLARVTAPVVQAPLPPGPVALSSELSVVCPQRAAPSYPAISSRLREVGMVVVRVELSETGEVAMARVQSSSGFDRLDQAALSAVRTWHCTPPTWHGQPVRATALQPFNFVK